MGKHKGGEGGTVVNIASVAGLGEKSACPVYDGTKFFVVGYSLSISVSCKVHFVMTVNVCEFHNILTCKSKKSL
jgi:short-subunit dehydrogenase